MGQRDVNSATTSSMRITEKKRNKERSEMMKKGEEKKRCSVVNMGMEFSNAMAVRDVV